MKLLSHKVNIAVYKMNIDDTVDTSYPDADLTPDGKIVLTYDRSRWSLREIAFCTFTEDDIINNREVKVNIVLKP